MKKNRFGFPENHLNSETRKKLHLENEILRIKLKAQTGSDLQHDGGALPPEIEHIFLKNILEFEESVAHCALIRLYDYIDRPPYPAPGKLGDEELEKALSDLTDALFRKNITVDFGTLPDNRSKYLFIIQELFPQEINDIRIGSMFLHFQYEEFHPNHEKDMRARTMEFISDWFERTMGKFSWELAFQCALPDGSILPRQEVLKKFRVIFEAFTGFTDCQYLVRNVHFEVRENEMKGVGHVEGAVKYNALLENGEQKFIEGPFKLFMAMEDNCWRIFYFVFPGFEW